MKIELTGLLQSATGPYGGRAAGTKLVTRKDGQVLVVKRKKAMTGDRVYVLHAWSRVLWIYVDALWQSLPQRIRAVWGQCALRTADNARSNLDEFRHVNIPRAFVGFPMLRLPPDRFRSHATYLPRPPQHSCHHRKPPMQIWVDGYEKPEPPWVPAPDEPVCPFPDCHPPPAPPFSPFEGAEPHPLVASASCVYVPCPDNVTYCYDELYCMMPVAFETKPGVDYFRWQALTNPERTWRSPVWDIKTEIHSKETWGDGFVYEKLMAENVQCYTGTYEGGTMPWPSGWCVKLTHWSAKAVKLSYAYYWRDSTELCPGQHFERAWVYHVYGAYPWPQHIYLQPKGDLIGDPPPCPPLVSGILEFVYPTGFWVDYTDNKQWAGFTWEVDSGRSAYPWTFLCAGPAFLSVSDIKCCDTAPRKGMWYFQIVVQHAGGPVLLEYRKPTVYADQTIFGTYFLHDPYNIHPWAAYGILVYDERKDWHDEEPTITWILVRKIAVFMICQLIGWFAHKGLSAAAAWAGLGTPYSYAPIQASLAAARPAIQTLGAGAWRCRLKAQIGAGAYQNHVLAREAMRRFRALKAIAP